MTPTQHIPPPKELTYYPQRKLMVPQTRYNMKIHSKWGKFLKISISHRIHVWYIYHYLPTLVDFDGKCR